MFAMTVLLGANSSNCGQLTAVRVTNDSFSHFWAGSDVFFINKQYLQANQIYMLNTEKDLADFRTLDEYRTYHRQIHLNDRIEAAEHHGHVKFANVLTDGLPPNFLASMYCQFPDGSKISPAIKPEVQKQIAKLIQTWQDELKTNSNQEKIVTTSNAQHYNTHNVYPSVKSHNDCVKQGKPHCDVSRQSKSKALSILSISLWGNQNSKNNAQRHPHNQPKHPVNPKNDRGHGNSRNHRKGR